jgi:hypothetical protein
VPEDARLQVPHQPAYGAARFRVDRLEAVPGRCLKLTVPRADQVVVESARNLPAKAGPVPDRLTIWPLDDGRYGLDATFQGASGFDRAEHHETDLISRGVPHQFKQELDGGWTLRFGPLAAIEVATALAAFVC